MICQLLSILTVVCLSLPALACNALRGKSFSQDTISRNKKQSLELDREFVKKGRQFGLSKNHIAAIVPTSLQATNDPAYVGNRIMSHTQASLRQMDLVKDNLIIRTVKKWEKQAAMAFSLKSTESKKTKKITYSLDQEGAKKEDARQPSGIRPSYNARASAFSLGDLKPLQHKFKFNLQALKREARFSYTGYVESEVEYKVQDDAFRFSLKEELTQGSTIALTHQQTRFGNQQSLQYRINW